MLIHLYKPGSWRTSAPMTVCGKPAMADSHECVLASHAALGMLPPSMTACQNCLAGIRSLMAR